MGNRNLYDIALIKSDTDVNKCVASLIGDEDDATDNSAKTLTSILTQILNQIKSKAGECLTILIQHSYVDRTFRDCYYRYFSSKHGEMERYCKRLFLFKGDFIKTLSNYDTANSENYLIGTIVIKPTRKGKVGRTLIDPKYFLADDKFQLRCGEFKVSLYGKKMSICAFPFSMQDQETLTCAEVTILNLMEYYSNQFADYRSVLPSDIAEVLEHNMFERSLPAHGMSYIDISRTLTEFGFSPRLYNTDGLNFDSYKMKCLLHYYVESAIPVAVGVRSLGGSLHSILVIGRGNYSVKGVEAPQLISERYADALDKRFYLRDIADYSSSYVIMDDTSTPYSTLEYKYQPLYDDYMLGDARVCSIVVPLYKRMSLEALDARSIVLKFLSDRAKLLDKIYVKHKESQNESIGSVDNPLTFRLFLASSNTFLEERIEKGVPSITLKKVYLETPMPRFLWIAELLDNDSLEKEETIGEIVLDATANRSDGVHAIILFRFMGYIAAWDREGKYICFGDTTATADMKSSDIALQEVRDIGIVKLFSSNLHPPD